MSEEKITRRIVNLTPHTVVVIREGEKPIEFPPSGTVARVTSRSVLVREVGGVPVVRTEYSDITGLPEPEKGTVFIVPTLVLLALKEGGTHRDDVVSPDTSPASVVRNEAGQIIGVRRFQVL